MTIINEINTLKTLAKRYARANRIAQHEALNALAVELSFPSWTKLVAKAKQGWLPSADQLAQTEAFVRGAHPHGEGQETFIERSFARPVDEPIREGKIGEHTYRVFEALGDIRMEGEGWRILVGEALLSQPVLEIEKPHATTSPVRNRDFLNAALSIADEEAAKVRGGISSDWPRRATKPDGEGAVVHPLFGGRAAKWYCLHCDGEITGAQLAQNLWHCPGCGASPIDIFSEPGWLNGSDAKPKPVARQQSQKRPDPKIEVVDSRPKLTLDEASISLLLRNALFDDAETPAERLGAQLAEIDIDDELDAWITLDEDLWPDSKEPSAAMAVAQLLGVELELSTTCMTFPFAWPGLGHVTASTPEYVKLLLEAHDEQGLILRKSKGD